MSSSSSSFLPPPLIGLTGGIASGKSTVSQLLQERKARVIDADHIARTVVLPESKGLSQLVNIWGDQILTPTGDLNRPALGTLIFNDPQARTQLNQILHPLIAQESAFQIQTAFKDAHAYPQTIPLIVYDAALLIESGRADQFRPLVVVSAPIDIQIQRIQDRDSLSYDQAKTRVDAQYPLNQKREVADFIIENHQDLNYLHQEVERLWTWLFTH
jgi:dephospho-CoA kinase